MANAATIPSPLKLQSRVLYEGDVSGLTLAAFGGKFDVTHLLSNGRASYLFFQYVVGLCLGLDGHSEGGDSDLCSGSTKFEVKAYADPDLHPAAGLDLFHTAASSLFGPNNRGPEIKKLLEDGRYDDALAICSTTGYAKNDFYVYTNTSGYVPTVPLRFVVLPTADVVSLLSKTDPRKVSRRDVLALVTHRETITAKRLGLTA